MKTIIITLVGCFLFVGCTMPNPPAHTQKTGVKMDVWKEKVDASRKKMDNVDPSSNIRSADE